MGLFEPAQAHVLPALESMENTTCKLLVGLSGSKKAKVVLIDDEAAAKSRLETETWLSKGRNLSELVEPSGKRNRKQQRMSRMRFMHFFQN